MDHGNEKPRQRTPHTKATKIRIMMWYIRYEKRNTSRKIFFTSRPLFFVFWSVISKTNHLSLLAYKYIIIVLFLYTYSVNLNHKSCPQVAVISNAYVNI